MIKITDGAAVLKSLTPKKEGKGKEAKILAIHMTFTCIAKAKGVTPDIFGNASQVFWDKEKDKNPLFFGLMSITSNSKVRNATLQFAGIVFDKEATLSKWVLKPRAHGMVELQFLATISDPTRDQRIGSLAQLGKQGKLEVEGVLDLNELMEESEEDSEEEKDEAQIELH